MQEKLKRKPFNWSVGKDTVIALVSAGLMLPIYFVNTQFGLDNAMVFMGVFVILGHLIVNTALPAYVVFNMQGEGLSGLGITKDKLLVSIAVSGLIAVLSYAQLQVLAGQQHIEWLPHLLFNALTFWEVLFVYGWLQLRFEKAFGYVVAPILSTFCFCLYHLGSFSLVEMPALLMSGLFFGILFGLTRNIFILYPLAWSVSSGIGTLMGGVIGTWDDVSVYLIILIVQIFIIYFLYHRSQLTKG